MNGCFPDPEKIVMNFNVNSDHASAQQLTRVLVDLDEEQMHLSNFADGATEHSDVRCAFDEAPHVPIAGTSTVSIFNENLQVD